MKKILTMALSFPAIFAVVSCSDVDMSKNIDEGKNEVKVYVDIKALLPEGDVDHIVLFQLGTVLYDGEYNGQDGKLLLSTMERPLPGILNLGLSLNKDFNPVAQYSAAVEVKEDAREILLNDYLKLN